MLTEVVAQKGSASNESQQIKPLGRTEMQTLKRHNMKRTENCYARPVHTATMPKKKPQAPLIQKDAFVAAHRTTAVAAAKATQMMFV